MINFVFFIKLSGVGIKQKFIIGIILNYNFLIDYVFFIVDDRCVWDIVIMEMRYNVKGFFCFDCQEIEFDIIMM